MKEIFDTWKTTTTGFAKLQWAYAAAAITILFIGGLISLIDNAAGAKVAAFSLYIGLIFVVNFVVSSVIATLTGSPKPRQTKR